MGVSDVKGMIDAAKAELDNLTAEEALRRVEEEGALLVDIRDVRELQREGVAPGAKHAPRGMLEFWVSPGSPYHDEDFAEDREYIFCCAGGWRSAFAARDMKAMGLERVSHVEPGFGGWKEAGLPVVDYADWKAAERG